MFKLEDIFEAYYDCRKNKRNTQSCIEFEINFDTNCIQLHEELNSRTYRVSESIAFIVDYPRKREIFAANFRDRVMHHLVSLKINPLIEQELTDRTYNNRVGKGAHACINQLKQDIWDVSKGYSRDCWIAKMDLKGFFMSLNKQRLVDISFDLIDSKYTGEDIEGLKWLLETLVLDSPEDNCELRSPASYWDDLDDSKSLFTVDKELGMPIGNLISQLLANYYLSDFDHFVERLFPHYGRYVDDFYIVSTHREGLLKAIPGMRAKLAERGITLHPDKFYFQHYTKGVEMLGAVVKPHRSYIMNRTINNGSQKLERLIKRGEGASEKHQAMVNSYLGLMGTHRNFKARKRFALKALKLKGFYMVDSFKKAILVEVLRERSIIAIKIRNDRQKVRKDKRT